MKKMKSLAAVMLGLLILCASQPVLAMSADAADDDDLFRPAERDATVLLRRSIFDPGRISLGLDGMFSTTSSRVELLSGGDTTDRTAFFRAEPQFSVIVIPNLEVGLSAGMVARRLAREDGASTDLALALQPLARYHIPATRRLAVYGQVGTGYFMGRTSRDIPIIGETLEDQQTSTRGFILTTGLGVNYRLSEGLQLRFGLKFNGLWGREHVELPGHDIDDRLSISTTNFGTSTGLRYTF